MAPGEEIDLHANGLRFTALAQGNGPIVLCVHGFPDTMRSFRLQLPALAAAGYRAVAPTLRGYQPSSQPPDGDYHIVRMAEDVVGWIDALGAERVHLVGHDWGAVIAYAVASLAPERLSSLCTIAIAHPTRLRDEGLRRLPSQVRKSWYMLFLQIRGLAEVAVEANDWRFIERLWRAWSPTWNFPPEELAHVKRALAQPGVKKAAIAYYRAMFNPFSRAARRTEALLSGPFRVRTLAATGALDGCMDTRLHDLAMRGEDFPAGLRVERFATAGHFLHQEVPDEFNALLIDWLRQ